MVNPVKPAIKTEQAGPSASPRFTSQPMHVYVTGVVYDVVPAGEQRSPPCGCGAKHGANYKQGPHATWDCPFTTWPTMALAWIPLQRPAGPSHLIS